MQNYRINERERIMTANNEPKKITNQDLRRLILNLVERVETSSLDKEEVDRRFRFVSESLQSTGS